jgi:hypothetical protein
VNVVASRKGVSGDPLLFKPIAFSTPSAAERLGGGALAAIVLGSLLGCVLGSLALLIIRRRKQLAHLSLLRRDEAVDMHQFGEGQLEPIGPLVASPLFSTNPAAEDGGSADGTAPLAPFAPNYGSAEGIGDAIAASIGRQHKPVDPLVVAVELELADDERGGHAPSHRAPMAVAMESESEDASESGLDAGGGDGGDNRGRGSLIAGAQERSDAR